MRSEPLLADAALPEPRLTNHREPGLLARYAEVSAAFEVCALVEATPREGGGFEVRERQLPRDQWHLKDYDEPAGAFRPMDWPDLLPHHSWNLLVMEDEAGTLLGGAAVITCRTDADVIAGARPQSAVLWDLRVQRFARGRGVGAALVRGAAAWARDVDRASHLAIETQDTNAPACRVYQRAGCELISVRPRAYADTPALASETMLIWSLALTSRASEAAASSNVPHLSPSPYPARGPEREAR